MKRLSKESRWRWRGWLLGLLLFNAWIVTAYGVATVAEREVLVGEGGLIENLTVVLYIIGLFVSLAAVWGKRGVAWINVLLAVGCLIAFLDEVSFGMDSLFTAEAFPEVFGKRIDGVHDLYEAMLRRTWAIYAVAIGFVAALSVGVVIARRRGQTITGLIRYLWTDPRLRLLGLAVAMGITATVFDDIWSDGSSRRGHLIEEGLEMSAAWCMAWASFLALCSKLVSRSGQDTR